MEINHFSHPEHPLILTKEGPLDESGNEVVCYGCQTPISGSDDDNSTSYECATCKFYLHKRCAEAPTKIIYGKHYQHPLTLLPHPSYSNSSCGCNVCKRRHWKWFTYNCSQCRFDIDIICALKDMDIICDVNEDRSLKHAGHEHSLTLQQRPALFHCDACETKSEDYSYSCNTCHFWIHKKCALLPGTMKFSHHNHALQLAYSFPKLYNRYAYECDICRKILVHTNWIYHCGLCRYFIHLKCAIKSNATLEPAMQSDEDYGNLEKFPINGDRSANMIREFVKKMSLGDADYDAVEEIKIDHWNHIEHPLILWDNQSKNTNIVYDGMLCAACIQPVTAPFYHCRECSYFLHKYCALLPLELRHESHQDHPLKLSERFFMFCSYCKTPSSGFYYYCEICQVYIDVWCISLPTKILHDSHRHPLISTSQVSDCRCEACYNKLSGIGYQCETCNFILHYRCAIRYPHTLTHDYDAHPIYLTYPPIENPSEFYCEICEEEIYPKWWIYCCKLCRYYFHVSCIQDPLSNVKFGDAIEVYNHPHLLTFIRNDGNNSPCLCEDCGEDQNNFPVLKCNECGLTICITCAPNRKELSFQDVDGADASS